VREARDQFVFELEHPARVRGDGVRAAAQDRLLARTPKMTEFALEGRVGEIARRDTQLRFRHRRQPYRANDRAEDGRPILGPRPIVSGATSPERGTEPSCARPGLPLPA